MNRCHEMEDLIITYFTSSLGPREADRLLAHLAACPACARYLREVGQVVEMLPYALPLVDPPEGLKEGVLSRIRAEGPQPRARRAGGWGMGRSGGFLSWRVAAALGLLLVFGIQGYALRSAYQLQGSLAADLAQTRLELAAAGTVLGEGRLQPEWILRMEKGAGFEQAWGHATAYSTRYGKVLVLAVGGLPPLEGGDIYRAWLIGDGIRVDGGVLRPDRAGFASLLLQLEHLDFHEIGIRREPRDGAAPIPQGPQVLFVRVDTGAGGA